MPRGLYRLCEPCSLGDHSTHTSELRAGTCARCPCQWTAPRDANIDHNELVRLATGTWQPLAGAEATIQALAKELLERREHVCAATPDADDPRGRAKAVQHSDDWWQIANEPATDDEIAMHRREANTDQCVACLDKLRLIARLERAEAELLELRKEYGPLMRMAQLACNRLCSFVAGHLVDCPFGQNASQHSFFEPGRFEPTPPICRPCSAAARRQTACAFNDAASPRIRFSADMKSAYFEPNLRDTIDDFKSVKYEPETNAAAAECTKSDHKLCTPTRCHVAFAEMRGVFQRRRRELSRVLCRPCWTDDHSNHAEDGTARECGAFLCMCIQRPATLAGRIQEVLERELPHHGPRVLKSLREALLKAIKPDDVPYWNRPHLNFSGAPIAYAKPADTAGEYGAFKEWLDARGVRLLPRQTILAELIFTSERGRAAMAGGIASGRTFVMQLIETYFDEKRKAGK